MSSLNIWFNKFFFFLWANKFSTEIVGILKVENSIWEYWVAETASLLIIQYSRGSRASANSILHARGRVCQPSWRMGAWPEWLDECRGGCLRQDYVVALEPQTPAYMVRGRENQGFQRAVAKFQSPIGHTALWFLGFRGSFCLCPPKRRAQLVFTTDIRSYLCLSWTLILYRIQIIRKATLIPF